MSVTHEKIKRLYSNLNVCQVFIEKIQIVFWSGSAAMITAVPAYGTLPILCQTRLHSILPRVIYLLNCLIFQ